MFERQYSVLLLNWKMSENPPQGPLQIDTQYGGKIFPATNYAKIISHGACTEQQVLGPSQ